MRRTGLAATLVTVFAASAVALAAPPGGRSSVPTAVAPAPSGTAQAVGALPPNELGRVMILEYHKIDYPENRWTRTPENFSRDLETLYTKGYRAVNLGDFLDRRIKTARG